MEKTVPIEVRFEKGGYELYINGEKVPKTTPQSTIDIRVDRAKGIASVSEYLFASDKRIHVYKGPIVSGDTDPKDWWRGLSSLQQVLIRDAVNGGTLPESLQEHMNVCGYTFEDFDFLIN